MIELNKYDFVVNNFVQLEEQLINCIDFIPFINENKNVISPKFIPIIVESCGLIESILKDISSKELDKLTFKKYYELHEEDLNLSDNKSLFLVSPLQALNPFKDWGNNQPIWWKAYNSLKHNRLENYSYAIYSNAIYSLCALHQLICRSRNFLASIIKVGWIDFNDSELPEQILSANYVGIFPYIAVGSKLFLSTTKEDLFEYVTDENEFELNYEISGISSRIRFLVSANEF